MTYQPHTMLVTGGAGFIGANFVRYVLEADRRVKVINLDLLTYAGHKENLEDLSDPSRHELVVGDICDRTMVDQLFRKHHIDTVVHFAAESHVDRSITGPAEFVRTNVVGTFTLLETARQFWMLEQGMDRSAIVNKRRFHHISTDEVYGSLSPTDPPFTETTPYEPNSPYSASKAGSDHLVRAYFHTYGLPVTTTNCSNNYGPYHFPEKLIPLMITNALAGKSLPVYGDGQNIRDWLYVTDHASAIHQVVQNGKVGETYNVGGGNEKNNIDIVKTICSILDSVAPRKNGGSYSDQIQFVTDRPGHDRRYAINASKLKKDLGWKPAETFETGIRKTIQWYLDNAAWSEQVLSENLSQSSVAIKMAYS